MKQILLLISYLIAFASTTTTFKVEVDLFAGSTGYFTVDGKGPSPRIQMKKGETYVFDQTHDTNWMHPLGFAYGRGATVEEAELVYKINGVQPTLNRDDYKPEFFLPVDQWLEKKYTVELTITDAIIQKAVGGVILYHCRIHSGMSGQIELLDEKGNKVTVNGEVPGPTKIPERGEFDKTCGTTDVKAYIPVEKNYLNYAKRLFGTNDNKCNDLKFVCAEKETTFTKCQEAIDCQMFDRMTVHHQKTNDKATFMHQMIPHHINAVNMAKILLNTQTWDMTNTDDSEIFWMARNIVNTQNYQIKVMKGWLNGQKFKAFDNQDVQCPMNHGNEVLLTWITVVLVVIILNLFICVIRLKCKGSKNGQADIESWKFQKVNRRIGAQKGK